MSVKKLLKTKTNTKEILKNASEDIISVMEKYELDFATTKVVLANILISIELVELEETSNQNKNQKGI